MQCMNCPPLNLLLHSVPIFAWINLIWLLFALRSYCFLSHRAIFFVILILLWSPSLLHCFLVLLLPSHIFLSFKNIVLFTSYYPLLLWYIISSLLFHEATTSIVSSWAIFSWFCLKSCCLRSQYAILLVTKIRHIWKNFLKVFS